MKKKQIEKIPFMDGKVCVRIMDVGGEETAITDVTCGGKYRICLTKKDYASYDYQEEKWTGKKINSLLDWYEVRTIADDPAGLVLCDWAFGISRYHNGRWYDAAGNIQNYIDSGRAEKKRKVRMEKIRDMMKNVPRIPNGFYGWGKRYVDRHVITTSPFYGSETTTGTCSFCGNVFQVTKGDVSQKNVRCPSCGKKGRVKRKNANNDWRGAMETYQQEVILFQRMKNDGFVERHFLFYKDIWENHEKYGSVEIGKIVRTGGKNSFFYHKYNPWTGKNFWDDCNLAGLNHIHLNPSPVYKGNISSEMFAGTPYRYCAMEYLKNEPCFTSPLKYLEYYEEAPVYEMVVKVGLKKLATEICPFDLVTDVKKPWDVLGLSRQEFYRLRDMNGGKLELLWVKYSSENHLGLDNGTIQNLAGFGILPEQVSFITDRMGYGEIANYVRKQSKNRPGHASETLRTWNDYLSMAARAKMDVSESCVYKPKDLMAAHDRLCRLMGGKAVAKRAAEVYGSFPEIDVILTEIQKKYEFSDGTYCITVPEKIEDIIREGSVLGHCVDKSDIYFARIQRRESYLVFLRKCVEPEKPYYTLEIEPDGTVRQKRTVGNKQGKDLADILPFLKKYQTQLTKKMSDSDTALALTSRQLREQEFSDLEKDRVRVRGGCLAGQLLVDVLRDDLLEAGIAV